MIRSKTQGVLAPKGFKVGNNISITYSINYGSNEIFPSGLKNGTHQLDGCFSEHR